MQPELEINALPPSSLLVSVRTPDEALAALVGGAEVIDVKEPSRGALGRAEVDCIRSIAKVVNGERPLTAAAGELVDGSEDCLREWLVDNPAVLLKFGLAGTLPLDWRSRLAERAAMVGDPTRLVPVAYADWQPASAPHPNEVASAAVQVGACWLLVDTFDKTGSGLVALWGLQRIEAFLSHAHRLGLRVAFAGQLCRGDLSQLSAIKPDLVGIRGAACCGGRTGAVDADLVRQLALERDSVLAKSRRLPAKKIRNYPESKAGSSEPQTRSKRRFS